MTIRRPAFFARGHVQQKIHLCNLHYVVALSEGETFDERFFTQQAMNDFVDQHTELIFENIFQTNRLKNLLPEDMEALVVQYLETYWHEQSPNINRIEMCQCGSLAEHFYEVDPTDDKRISQPLYTIEELILSIVDVPVQKSTKKKVKLGSTSQFSPDDIKRITHNSQVGVVPAHLLERPEQVLSHKLKCLFDEQVPFTRDEMFKVFISQHGDKFDGTIKTEHHEQMFNAYMQCRTPSIS